MRRGSESGQAVVETLLLLGVATVFIAAAFQLHLVNQTIFRSLAAVHQLVFERAFARNCHADNGQCDYSQDPASEGFGGAPALVVWSPDEVPEVRIPIIGEFDRAVAFGRDGLRLSSSRPGADDRCPGLPCKRTRIGAGTYMTWYRALLFLGTLNDIEPDQMAGYTAALGADVFDYGIDPRVAAGLIDALSRILRTIRF